MPPDSAAAALVRAAGLPLLGVRERRVLLAAARRPAGRRIGAGCASTRPRPRSRTFATRALSIRRLTAPSASLLFSPPLEIRRRGQDGGRTGSQNLDPQRAAARAVDRRRLFIRLALQREHLAAAHRRGARRDRAAAVARCSTRRPACGATWSPGRETFLALRSRPRPWRDPLDAGPRADVRQRRPAGAAARSSADPRASSAVSRRSSAPRRAGPGRPRAAAVDDGPQADDGRRAPCSRRWRPRRCASTASASASDPALGRDRGVVDRRHAGVRRGRRPAGGAAPRRRAPPAPPRKSSACCRPCSRASTTASRCRIGRGKLIFANASAARLIGFATPEALLGGVDRGDHGAVRAARRERPPVPARQAAGARGVDRRRRGEGRSDALPRAQGGPVAMVDGATRIRHRRRPAPSCRRSTCSAT